MSAVSAAVMVMVIVMVSGTGAQCHGSVLDNQLVEGMGGICDRAIVGWWPSTKLCRRDVPIAVL